MFIGEFRNKIDEKGRLRIPPKLKEDLGTVYYVTKGDNRCLYVLTKESFEELFEKLKTVHHADVEGRNIFRFIISSAKKPEEDGQGRILLSQSLREHAGLTRDVVIIGAGDRVEIWDEGNWNKTNDEGDFDSYLRSLSKYEI
ncbi:MAG: division/cell wall cluster transcriptional repressor MraZ [Clostridia bacterium]|nr:division/cell wall cluster transcriptional repressor MraZ [Clostridia bacterium]